jgi:hypothetical protein
MFSNKKKYYHFIFDLKSCESCDIIYKYIIYSDSIDSQVFTYKKNVTIININIKLKH